MVLVRLRRPGAAGADGALLLVRDRPTPVKVLAKAWVVREGDVIGHSAVLQLHDELIIEVGVEMRSEPGLGVGGWGVGARE